MVENLKKIYHLFTIDEKKSTNQNLQENIKQIDKIIEECENFDIELLQKLKLKEIT